MQNKTVEKENCELPFSSLITRFVLDMKIDYYVKEQRNFAHKTIERDREDKRLVVQGLNQYQTRS